MLDADIAIENDANLDDLFTEYPNSKLVSEGLGADSPLRAGWLMVRPSYEDFEKLEQIITDGNFDEELGWDYLSLPVEYPGWKNNKAAPDWGFYGSNLEQGLLFHYFYALPKSILPFEDQSKLLTLIGDEDMLRNGIVHFYGSRKPWNKVFDAALPPQVRRAQDRWLKTFESIRSNNTRSLLPKYSSPLTNVGVRRYTKNKCLYEEEDSCDCICSTKSTKGSSKSSTKVRYYL